VLIAMFLTVVIMGAVFGLLQRGQRGFQREPEISELNQNARVGVDMISRDLVMAGYKTPVTSAVLWADGGDINPDEITVVFADPNVPLSKPRRCSPQGAGSSGGAGGGGACNTISESSVINIEPETLDPLQAYPEYAYSEGMILFALETGDCNEDGAMGMYPFEVSRPPQMTHADGRPTLQIIHNPGRQETGLNLPNGFNRQVEPDCAIIGRFRVIQYRINPLPPAPNPTLERRDLSNGEPWIPVAKNIENLQFQYAAGTSTSFLDVPTMPDPENVETWITQVRFSVVGRTESTNLEGASEGVFSPEDTHVRKTFATTVSLRNTILAAEFKLSGPS
jgi:hypothetical protein